MQLIAILKNANDHFVDQLVSDSHPNLLAKMKSSWPKTKLRVGDRIRFEARNDRKLLAAKTFTVDTLY